MNADQTIAEASGPFAVPILRTVEDGIATVTLNSAKSINALSEEVLSALQTTWNQIAQDRSIKVVILRGAGENFCAGHNLKEMTARRNHPDGGKQYFIDLFEKCSKMMMSIVQLPQPVIAEVRGVATAAGCQLVASCDLAVAATTTRFATSGINIGLFCSTPMVALSRNVSRKNAMEMLLLGEFIPAVRAHEMGLINRVVPETALDAETMKMARVIADKSPVAVKIGKVGYHKQVEMPLEEAYVYAGWAMAENMMTRDAELGIESFIDKRPMPGWSGE